MVWDVLREDGGHLSAEESGRVRSPFQRYPSVYRAPVVSGAEPGGRDMPRLRAPLLKWRRGCSTWCANAVGVSLPGRPKGATRTEFGFHAQEATVFGICGTCLAQEETEEEEAGGHAYS